MASNANKLTVWSAVMPLANTRPATTTGLPMPSPRLADQRTFSVAENVVGSGCIDAEMPEQFGPRNWGQSSAFTVATCQTRTAMATRYRQIKGDGMNV